MNTTATAMASTRWEYDAGGRLAQSCDTSDPDTDCDDGGSAIVRAIVPTYDAVGRTTRTDTYAGAQTTLALRTDTTYLGDGQPAQAKAYEGASPTLIDTLDFGYDELGRPTSITRDGSTVIADQTWNPDGTAGGSSSSRTRWRCSPRSSGTPSGLWTRWTSCGPVMPSTRFGSGCDLATYWASG